jgi:hypothetical protein
MVRISATPAVLGPCAAIALSVILAACSAGDPAHRSFRPQVITASGVPYTGNGIAQLDPQAIVAQTVKATSSAPTVHLVGVLTGVPVPAEGIDTPTFDAAQPPDAAEASSPTAAVPAVAGSLSLDMVFTRFGAVGDVTNGSVTSRLLRVEDEVWAAEPASFWNAAGALDGGKAYGGLYVRIPTADPRYAGFTDDTRIGFLLDRLLQTSATWKKGPVGTVGGVPSLELDGTGRDGHRASLWVATDGEPYIMRIAPTDGGYAGRIDFTDYDERLAVQAPLPGQVLDNALIVLPPPSTPASFVPTPDAPTVAPTSAPQSTPAGTPSAVRSSSPAPSAPPTPSFSFPPPSSPPVPTPSLTDPTRFR